MPANIEYKPILVKSAVEFAMFRTIKFISVNNLVKVITSSRYNSRDHFRMLEEIVMSAGWKPGMNILFDSRNQNFDSASLEVLKQASRRRIKYDQQIGGKTAMLMKSVTDFARGRQYELLTEGKISAQVRVFQHEAAALRWLVTDN